MKHQVFDYYNWVSDTLLGKELKDLPRSDVATKYYKDINDVSSAIAAMLTDYGDENGINDLQDVMDNYGK